MKVKDEGDGGGGDDERLPALTVSAFRMELHPRIAKGMRLRLCDSLAFT